MMRGSWMQNKKVKSGHEKSLKLAHNLSVLPVKYRAAVRDTKKRSFITYAPLLEKFQILDVLF